MLNYKCFLEESCQLMRLPPRQSTAEADLMVPFQLVRLKYHKFMQFNIVSVKCLMFIIL